MASHSSYNITISHPRSAPGSEHSSSVTDGEDSSGTGVQVSPTSAGGSQEYSELDSSEGIWVPYPDDLGPSDSASRPRTSNQHRSLPEAPDPEPARRHPARRQRPSERIHHHTVQRTRRPNLPTSSGSVDSNEEWPAYHGRGPPQYYGRTYAHYSHQAAPNPANYAPTYNSAQLYPPYHGPNIIPQGQQLVPFSSPPAQYNYPSYPGAAGAQASGYFPPPQHGAPPMGNPMIPHPAAPYTGQEMMHHTPTPAIYPYAAQGYPMHQPMVPAAMYPPYPAVYSPGPANTPPPAADSAKDDEKLARIEKLFLDQKAEQEAKEAAAAQAAKDAAAKAEADKKIAEEIAAAAAAAAAAATEEAEKKAADKAAALAAEDAAKAKAAADEAEKKAADAAAAAAAAPPPPPPPPEEKKKPIKFKDAVGRKFSFPFHLCSTWDGMDYLIRQAFLHVEVIGPHVAEGHYDLVGPNGEIILPQVWETVIEPDWTITMHMWPMPEPPKPEELPLDGLVVDVPAGDGKGAPPPPPPPPGGAVVVVPETGKKSKSKNQKLSPFVAWTAGGRSNKSKSLKAERKPERSRLAWELMSWGHNLNGPARCNSISYLAGHLVVTALR
ncbi:MAG: hypothetical protein Q9174_001585 [Haloplaca sp. 1 TL-2023]